ncbi:unnamed protein product [Knipowitschia caucasica]
MVRRAEHDDEGFKIILKFKDELRKVPNPLRLSSEIRDKIGEILHAKILSNGNVFLLCKTEAQRKKALLIKELDKRAVQGLVPGSNLLSDQGAKGVVYIDTDVSEDDIFKNLKGGEVLGVKRFKTRRQGEERDSTAVLILFGEEVMPQRVTLGFMAFQVKPYVRPPLRCYKCQRFGHVAAVCRGEKRCGKCGGGHDYSECTNSEVKCCNCGGNHVAAYRGCGVHVKAQEVETIKKTENISYAEAVRRVKETGQEGQKAQSESLNQSGGQVSDDCFVVRKVAFFAFLVEVLWAARQVDTPSGIKAMIAKEAGRFLGTEVSPEHLNLAHARRGSQGGGASQSGESSSVG